MRLLSLNIAGGTLLKPLLAYMQRQAPTTDIFVFQEMCDTDDPSAPEVFAEAYPRCLKLLGAALPDFACFYEVNRKNVLMSLPTDFSATEGAVAFVRKSIEVEESRQIELYAGNPDRPMSHHGRPNFRASMQALTLKTKTGRFVVAHLQGVAYPGDKLDSPERLEQARIFREFVLAQNLPLIIGGDLNLDPATRSFSLMRTGLRDLIAQYDIFTTRNRVIWEKFPGDPQFFADFLFVSPGIDVRDFRVPYLEISDHLPMILDFELT